MEVQEALFILSARKDKHFLLVYIYYLSPNTGSFYNYLLNATGHCKELSVIINLRSD